MKRPVVLAMAAAALVACEGATPPFGVSVAGIWDFTAVRTGTTIGTCHDTGSVTIVPVGSAFAGRWEFVGACGTFSYQAADSVLAGTLSGNTITFDLGTFLSGAVLCRDTATVSPGSDSLLGSGTCFGDHFAFTAVRERPLGSIAVSPTQAQRLVGDSATFQAVQHATNGARVFGRPVVWTSDSVLVAAVSQLGKATALSPGPATIKAALGPLSGSATFTVAGFSNLRSVAAGDARTCALGAAGDLRCWGIVYGNTPTPIGGGQVFFNLTMGRDFGCGLVSGGAAYCFGSNDSGQLGNGTKISSTMPVPVSGGLTFRAISAGGNHACGISVAGDAWCWGSNYGGELGNGTMTASSVPVLVGGGINFYTVTSGGHHTCAIRGVDSLAFCWGDNSFGQLGDSTTTRRLAPVRVGYAGTLAPLSAGDNHTCGSALNRTAYCWGSNIGGQLGTGNTVDSHYPIPVIGGQQFIQVVAGSIHTCALDVVAAAWCWGVNSWGQLGNGTVTSGSNQPVMVSGGLHYVALSLGMYSYSDESINGGTAGHTCGVTTGAGGATYCWGVNNIGQIGTGTRSFSAVTAPVKVAGQP